MADAPRLSDAEAEKLIAEAHKARANAYAPYSHFSVGAALLFDGGAVISGCNVENASYGLSLCAERGAMASAAARGLLHPKAVAVVGADGKPCPPCGACRQFLAEFNPDMTVILEDGGGYAAYRLGELLPHTFSLEGPSFADARKENI